MFGYYCTLALSNLRRNMVFTALMIIAIGVGIGASMTMLTVFRAASGDPIPQKSAQLFVAQIDNFGPGGRWRGYSDSLPPVLTYIDVSAWLQAHAGVRQAALYPTTLSIAAADPTDSPTQIYALATSSDFFPMFGAPFQYGGPWSRADDDGHAAVIVLTRALNDRLFAGSNSVGRTLTISKRAYRIIGVLDKWHPSPRFYDVGGLAYSGEDQLFLPFTRAIDEQMPTYSILNCDGTGTGKGWNGLLHSNCIWLHFWVELPSARDVANYAAFLHNYAVQQRRTGRFQWLAHVALRNVTQWLKYSHVVPPAVETLTSVAFALLLVCVLNAIGLMLANVMARAGAVGVRRALGATRRAIFAQLMVESGVIGLAGGLVGVGLTQVGLAGCRALLDTDLSGLAHLHGSDLLIALMVALTAMLLAGLYPTWRAMQVQPALQLKTL